MAAFLPWDAGLKLNARLILAPRSQSEGNSPTGQRPHMHLFTDRVTRSLAETWTRCLSFVGLRWPDDILQVCSEDCRIALCG
jgi:hypothetical protein